MIPSINLIVTGGTDKTMFFFKFVTTEKGIDMNPIRCIKLDEVAINFEWVSNGVRQGQLNIWKEHSHTDL